MMKLPYHSPQFICWMVLLGMGLLLGCGRGSNIERVIISGTVSFQDKPVPDGMIAFVPVKATKGPTSSAIIKGGRYKVDAIGGVPLGTHRVEIQAFRPLSANRRPNRLPHLEDREPREQYLPDKFNRQSTLEVTIEAKGEPIKNFNLK
jgi:hypothetical protein